MQSLYIKRQQKLTGCKNFSRIKRVDAHTAEILDWGITLHTNQEIDEQATWFGYRAHDFVPVWGKRKENCLKINVESEAALPFERNYYLYPEGEENQDKQTICWFLQREKVGKNRRKRNAGLSGAYGRGHDVSERIKERFQ